MNLKKIEVTYDEFGHCMKTDFDAAKKNSQSLVRLEDQPHNSYLETLLRYSDSYILPVSFAHAHGRCPTLTAEN
jgi:hypothetical protein